MASLPGNATLSKTTEEVYNHHSLLVLRLLTFKCTVKRPPLHEEVQHHVSAMTGREVNMFQKSFGLFDKKNINSNVNAKHTS